LNVNGRHRRSIWSEGDDIFIVDQLALPFEFRVQQLHSLDDAVAAIASMRVRGAPLIGATAAFGLALAAREQCDDAALEHAGARLRAARPTAVNLQWAVRRMLETLRAVPEARRADVALAAARTIADEDVANNRRIGEHGVNVLRGLAARKRGGPLNILTHCNAGWLATVDWGTATAPIYLATREGIDVHVWVDETRPRLQGALTAWELAQEGVPHTVIADNTGGHLMQRGLVDVVITGTDRVTRQGDAANKIGTYLKALAAHDNGVPFYVAAPTPSIDFAMRAGTDIPIEERDARELTHIRGVSASREPVDVRLYDAGSPVLNVGFDVTPARLITGLITEFGVVEAAGEPLGRLERQVQHRTSMSGAAPARA
jgi:methylthioribose-1-phosphate isomerase